MLKKSQELLDSFDVDAQYYGREQYQGSPTLDHAAEEDYLASKAALVKRIEYLETKNRKLAANVKFGPFAKGSWSSK